MCDGACGYITDEPSLRTRSGDRYTVFRISVASWKLSDENGSDNNKTKDQIS